MGKKQNIHVVKESVGNIIPSQKNKKPDAGIPERPIFLRPFQPCQQTIKIGTKKKITIRSGKKGKMRQSVNMYSETRA